MRAKLFLVLILASLALSAWAAPYPSIVRLPTPARIEVVCNDGQIPTVWVHMNAAVVRCE